MTLGDHVYRRKRNHPDPGNVGQHRPAGQLAARRPGQVVSPSVKPRPERSGGRHNSLLGRLYMNTPTRTAHLPPSIGVLATIPAERHQDRRRRNARRSHQRESGNGLALERPRQRACSGRTRTCPTADERVSCPAGSAYVTDLGMTGPYDSVLGRTIVIAFSAGDDDRAYQTRSTSPRTMSRLCGVRGDRGIDDRSGRPRSNCISFNGTSES